MIRTTLLVILLCICILIGIGFACMALINYDQLGAPSDISLVAFSVVTGYIVIAGSVRALISMIRRSRF